MKVSEITAKLVELIALVGDVEVQHSVNILGKNYIRPVTTLSVLCGESGQSLDGVLIQ